MKHPRRHIRPFASLSLAGSLVLLGLASSPSDSLPNNRDKQTPSSLTAQPRSVESYGKLPLSFEANVGQTSSQVDFLSRGQGYTLFLTRRAEAVLVLGKSAPERTPAQPTDKLSAVVKPQPEVTPPAVVRIKLVGAKLTPQVEGLEEFPGKANYFIGNDPKKWRTNVPMYAKVRAHAVYPGVDLVYYGNQRQLEHDFIVAPGADPGAITMAVEGAERLSLGAQGDLVLQMKNEQVRFQKPVAYQEVEGVRREIPSSYRLKNAHRVGFQVAAYDGSRPLIIDPVLAYSTYLGGSGGDGGNAIALDASGNAYVTGFTISTDFPTTTGAYQTTLKGNGNAFVTKLNPSLSGLASLVYSTFLGGSGENEGKGIAVDSSGSAYVTGGTSSSDFPTTLGAYQTTFGGNRDAFVTKLNPTGSTLAYSTYLGGSDDDEGAGIAVDTSGNAYVTGGTLSGNFPTTLGAYQRTSGGTGFGGGDAFVTKLNPSLPGLASLVYSTYLGGSGDENFIFSIKTSNSVRGAIAVDASGNAYVTGFTISTDFPTTTGAYQTTLKGNGNAFVTKLNPSLPGLASLVYSTYLGGSNNDFGLGIAVDAAGNNAYVTGGTTSSDFPTTLGAYQTTLKDTNNAFVTKLNPSLPGLASLVYSTYLGGSTGTGNGGNAITVDAAGNAYVTGSTGLTDFPTTTGAYQTTLKGYDNAFLTALNPPGTGLAYSSYLGGSVQDSGQGIAVDAAGNAYVTGGTFSSDFPTTLGAYQTTFKACCGGNAFVTKIANITCKPEKDDVKGDGHEKGDDGREGEFHFCKSSGEMDFDERDGDRKIVGQPIKGKINTVTVSRNQAIITGSGTLADGTPVNYTAVVLGNQPVIGANHFAISWIPANGSVFQTSGALTDGYIVVQPQ